MTVPDRKLWIQLLATAMLVLPVTQLYALGLGEATVRSYMRQPLDVRIRLISRSEAELASVSAGLASAEDFQVMGLDRSMIGVPLEFSISPDLSDPFIQVRSRQSINDPVVQLVVEVVWSSGRMLRQYTLFLDPPTFESAAPLPAPSPRSSKAEPAPELAQQGPQRDTGPPFEPQAEAASAGAPEIASQTGEDDEPSLPSETSLVDDPAAEAGSGAEAPTEYGTETTLEPRESPDEPPLRGVTDTQGQAAGEYGPVRRGETLWRIASAWGRQHGLGTNQVMLAIQQQNPGAFVNDNINLLKRGAILRMPSAAQINAWSARQAMREVMRQDDLWRNPDRLPVEPGGLPTVANLASEPQPDPEPARVDAEDDAELGHLELVPPTGSETAGEADLGQGNSDDNTGTKGESTVEELARTREELANAQQENSYLNDRIRELEEELGRREAAAALEVEDAGLAEMEQRLRDDRLSGEPQAPVALTPPREEPAWYARYAWWAGGAFLVIVAALVWWIRSRAADGTVEHGHGGQPGQPPQVEAAMAAQQARSQDDKVVDLGRFKKPSARFQSLHRPDPDEEAVELDSNDPETKLDLARAYISMGDAEAARVLLEEVVAAGSDEQAMEARTMLEEL